MELQKNNLDSEMDQNQYIVIDNGTSQIKIGYSGEN
jgi:actin-related protein